MAIETLQSGLWTPQLAPEPQRVLPFRKGTPDVAEATGVTMDMLAYLGALTDANREATETAVRDSFATDAALGLDGRLFMRLPAQNAPFEALLAAAEGRKPEDVVGVWRYANLWTPGTEANSYTTAELDGEQVKAVTRLALFGVAETSVDPVLHYTSLPYDDVAKAAYNPDAETTQLAEFAADQKAFAVATREEREIDAADQRDYLVWALMDRIRGVDPQSSEFILNSSFMRIAKLGRRARAVYGDSVVGDVCSVGGQLKFDGSFGGASSFEGLGVVAGQQD